MTATLAITKADAKDALLNPNEKLDTFHVEWMNVETSSKKEDQAKLLARRFGELICLVNYKERLSIYITNLRSQSDDALMKLYDQLPEIEKISIKCRRI